MSSRSHQHGHPHDHPHPHPHRPGRRPAIVAALAASVVAACWLAFCLLVPAGDARLKVVEFPPGTRVAAISRELESAGIVRSAFWFRVVTRVWGRPLQAGEYGFRRASLVRVVWSMQNGRVYLHRLLVREGDSIGQIVEAAGKEGLAAGEIRRAARDRALLERLGVPGPSAEGFLFPDTYLIPKLFTGEQVVSMMVRRFHERVPTDTIEKAKKAGFGLLRLVTLASIVEKEAQDPGERAVIAGVFRNRLRRGMLLQADPTVLYGLGRWDTRLSLRDLESDSRYNTYRYAGLPPGPICSPGLACLEAAAAPAKVPYLYFVTRKDGTGRHQFSRTLSEHRRAVAESKKRARGGAGR